MGHALRELSRSCWRVEGLFSRSYPRESSPGALLVRDNPARARPESASQIFVALVLEAEWGSTIAALRNKEDADSGSACCQPLADVIRCIAMHLRLQK
jgi:hypothetical protein